MNTAHGFSLTEVLIALLLISSTSLALLKQQWHMSQLLNQAILRTQALLMLDNVSEQWGSGDPIMASDQRFNIIKRASTVQVTWAVAEGKTDVLTRTMI